MNSESNLPESSAAPVEADAHSPAPPPSRLRSVFIGANGLRAGWRLAIYVVLFGIFVSVAFSLLRFIPAFVKLLKLARAGTLTPGYLITSEVVQFGMALAAAAILCRIENGEFGSYGIPLRGAFGRNLWNGIIWGLAFETIVLAAIKGLGGFSFGSLAIAGSAIAKYAALWAVGFLLVGFAEEFVFRGYTRYTLAKGIGFWPAAILLSAVFGGVHLVNTGEDWIGALEVFTFGMFACFTLRKTGSLWFAIGFHAAGDYAQSFLYSVRDSGTFAIGHLLNSSFHGPAWLTGGTVGPEGSVLDFAVFALAFLLFAWLYRSKPADWQTPQPATPAAL